MSLSTWVIFILLVVVLVTLISNIPESPKDDKRDVQSTPICRDLPYEVGDRIFCECGQFLREYCDITQTKYD